MPKPTTAFTSDTISRKKGKVLVRKGGKGRGRYWKSKGKIKKPYHLEAEAKKARLRRSRKAFQTCASIVNDITEKRAWSNSTAMAFEKLDNDDSW